MSDSPLNPLYGVRIGQRFDQREKIKDSFRALVLEEGLTKVVGSSDTQYKISGESQYIHTAMSNQASLGVQGSYGISALAKVEASVGAYLGNAVATDCKEVTIDYDLYHWSGIEYVDLESLNPVSLMCSLNGAAKQDADEALDKYKVLIDLKQGKLKDKMTEEDLSVKAVSEALTDWRDSVANFIKNHGSGLVVGILWGGMGRVRTVLKSSSHDSVWKYGTEGNFSYQALTASVTIQATYDGSQSQSDANVKADIEGYASGTCVEDQVKVWVNAVKAAVDKELLDVSVFAKAPNLSDTVKIPSAKPFKQPQVEKKLADKIDQVKDLKGLEVLAKAMAFDEAKKKDENKSLTLVDFLKKFDEQADQTGLTTLTHEVNTNNISTEKNKKKVQLTSHVGHTTSLASTLKGSTSDDSPSGDVPMDAQNAPLGVWIANWCDLFPWLATSSVNNISDDSINPIRQLLQARMMIQDFRAISRLYFALARHGLSVGSDSTPGEIAISFQHQANGLEEALSGTTPDLENELEKVRGRLSAAAENIYKVWSQSNMFRNCELGVGFTIYTRANPGWPEIKDWHYDNKNDWYYDVLRSFKDFDVNKKKATLTQCHFDPSRGNYDAFASLMKGYPVILTNDNIVMVFGGKDEKGKEQMYYLRFPLPFPLTDAKFTDKPDEACTFKISERTDDGHMGQACFTRWHYYQPTSDPKQGRHVSTVGMPIPFSAADGISDVWQGASLGTNVASLPGLSKSLKELDTKLRNQRVMSVSSDRWRGRSATDDYRLQELRPTLQYLGLVDEITTIFGAG